MAAEKNGTIDGDASASPRVAKTVDAAPAGPDEPGRIAVSEHPRASRFVRKARELGGIGGFVLGTWMSLSTHSLTEALLRGLAAGIVCQLVVWAVTVTLCRHLIVAEIKSREHALMQAAAARLEAGRRGAAPGGEAGPAIQGRARS